MINDEKDNHAKTDKKEDLKEALLFETLFEGLAEGAGLTKKEAKRAVSIIMMHNTADFVINNLFQYFFAADQVRGLMLQEHLLSGLDFLRKAKTLKKACVIDKKLFESLEKLNDIRVALAHGKEKDDPRLQYKKTNVLEANYDIMMELDERTVQKLLELTEKIRRLRIYKDKWPERPFIYELYDKDRK